MHIHFFCSVSRKTVTSFLRLFLWSFYGVLVTGEILASDPADEAQERARYTLHQLEEDLISVTQAEPDIRLEVYEALSLNLFPKIQQDPALTGAWNSLWSHALDPEMLVGKESLLFKGEEEGFKRLTLAIAEIDHFKNNTPASLLTTSLKELFNKLQAFYLAFQNQCKEKLAILHQEKSSEAMRQLDQALEPKALMISERGKNHSYYRLSQTTARHLVCKDEHGLDVKHLEGSTSNHPVSWLPSSSPHVFFKRDGHPSLNICSEATVQSLYHLLEIPMPSSFLVMIDHVKFGDTYSNAPFYIQASQAVAGENAKKVLKDGKSLNITEENYAQQVIGALLTAPNDGKPDNFISHLLLGLMSIDNDEVFSSPILNGSLHLKSLLLALPQMEHPLPASTRHFLESLSPEFFILRWLRTLEGRHHSQKIFLDKIAFHIKHSKRIQHSLTDIQRHLSEELRLPLMLPFSVIDEVLQRLCKLKSALRDHKSLTFHEAFEHLYSPFLAGYYKHLRDKLSPYDVMHVLYGIPPEGAHEYLTFDKWKQQEDLSSFDQRSSSPLLPSTLKEGFKQRERASLADEVVQSLLTSLRHQKPEQVKALTIKSLKVLEKENSLTINNPKDLMILMRKTGIDPTLLTPFSNANPSLKWLLLIEEHFPLQSITQDDLPLKGGWMRDRVMPSMMAKHLIETGRLKKNPTLSGRSCVNFYPSINPLFFFKEYPEFPGYEYGAIKFMRRMEIEHLPFSDLVILNPKSLQPVPLLLTQAVAGDLLKKHWDKPLRALDPHHTAKLILAAMLINPEDGKEDNYLLSPDQKYLIPIDHDHVFLPGATREEVGLVKSKINTTLQSKTILFCLDEMKRAVPDEVRKSILDINVDMFLEGWLKDLVKVNDLYQELLTPSLQQKIFNEKGTVLRIPLEAAFVQNLYWKFYQLQSILQERPTISLIELLGSLEPYLGKMYGAVLHLPTLEARFKKVTKNLYITDHKGTHMSVLNSRQMLEITRIPLSEVTGSPHSSKQGPSAALTLLAQLKKKHQDKEWPEYLKGAKEPQAIDGSRGDEEKVYIESLKKASERPEMLVIHNSRRLYGSIFYGDQLTPLLDHDRGVTFKLIDLRGGRGIDLQAVQTIARLAPNLEVLNVSRCPSLKKVHGSTPQEQLMFPSLKRLLIKNCSALTHLYLKAPVLKLLEASGNSVLTEVKLEAPQLLGMNLKGWPYKGEEEMRIFAHLLPHTGVSTLDLQQWAVGDSGIKILSTALPQTKITFLDLRQNNISDVGLESLALMLPQTRISILYLDTHKIGVEGIQFLVKVFPQTQIQKLGESWQEEVLSLFLPVNAQKEDLNLRSKSVKDQDMQIITSFFPQIKITVLDLRNNQVGNEGLKILASVLPQTRLSILYLDTHKIGVAGMQSLAKALPQTQIQKLGESWQEEVLSLFLPVNAQKKDLNLSSKKLQDKDIQLIISVLPKTQISTLYLESNQIWAKGMKALALVLPKTQISTLNLNNNQIGAEGMKALAPILPRTQISTLYLSDNQIRAERLKTLAPILPQTQITFLDLRNNQIGDEGMKTLAPILPQTQISTLDLGSNEIRAEGISSRTSSNSDLIPLPFQ